MEISVLDDIRADASEAVACGWSAEDLSQAAGRNALKKAGAAWRSGSVLDDRAARRQRTLPARQLLHSEFQAQQPAPFLAGEQSLLPRLRQKFSQRLGIEQG